MKRLHWGWYLLIGAVALAPVSARMLSWKKIKIAAVDPAMAQAGQTLFMHEWKPNDPLANGGDGLGPVFNANSCVACHNQGGDGGAGGLEHNVTTFSVTRVGGALLDKPREGVIHAQAVSDNDRESLQQVNLAATPAQMVTQDNHCVRLPPPVHVSQRNTPALFGARLIDGIPDRILVAEERKQQLMWGLAPKKSEDLPVGRALRLAGGRIGHFGWKAQSASLSDFVQAACANELGLGNPGQAQPRPLGNPLYQPVGLDLTSEQCDQITAFVASLSRPVERLGDISASEAASGKALFSKTGCADCHAPKLGDVEGLYSDLLLHDMGVPLQGGGSYNEPPPQRPDRSPGEGPQPGEWRTPPLWGVADSAPYLHDGRARTLRQAIEQHGGQATRSAQKFAALGKEKQEILIAFLKTLRAP